MPEQSQPFAPLPRPRDVRIYNLNHAAHLEAAGHHCLRVEVDAQQDRARFIFGPDASAVYDHYRATLDRLRARERAARGVLLEREAGL
jgi:hypothetical protein